MCLIVFAYDFHKKYRLILSANRDEYYNRPTEKLDFWKDEPEILGGRDLQQGGTWMAFDKKGRFAALTNVRDPASMKSAARSRGDLIPAYLLSDMPPEHYLETVGEHEQKYNPFNLLAGDLNSLFFFSSTDQKIISVPPGIHGVCNHTLNTPWVKVEKVKKGLGKLLENREDEPENFDIEPHLYRMMRNRDGAADELLPDTGVGIELERKLSSVFVSIPGYGTRSTSVVFMERNGSLTFSETTWSEDCEEEGYRSLKI